MPLLIFPAIAEGVYVRVGTKDPADPDTEYRHHPENVDIDERGFAITTKLHVRYVFDFLTE